MNAYRDLLGVIHQEARLAARMSTTTLDTATVVATDDPVDGIVVRPDSSVGLAGDCLTMGVIGGLSVGDRVLVLYQNERHFIVGFIGDATGVSVPARAYYGSFYDTTTQSAAATGTAYAMTYNHTDASDGVHIDPTHTSHVVFEHPGVYNLQFSVQLDKSAGSTGLIYIWLRQDGIDVANSASEVAIQGTNAQNIAAWNFFVTVAEAGQYAELMWSVSDNRVQLKAVPAASPVPAIPSVILTAQQVSE